MTDRFRILHLSDFHFSESSQWDRAVFEQLLEAIGVFVKAGQLPDLIAVAGDVACNGKSTEFELARNWIDTQLSQVVPGLDRTTNVFFVPGNRDVDCNPDEVWVTKHEEYLREYDDAKIAAFLSSPDAAHVLRRHDSYRAFASATASSLLPWWGRMHDHQGHCIGFAGLASSLISRGASEEDYGKLVITRYQMNDVFQAIRTADVRIALIHHPTSFLSLKRQEQWSVQARLIQECSLVLRGHLQHARSVLHWEPDFQMLELGTAGIRPRSGHDASGRRHTFHLIELDFDQKKTFVHHRLWHDGRWIADRNAYQAAPNGIAEFPLRTFRKSEP